MTVRLLGDQLHPAYHVLDGADRILLIEATAFVDAYHWVTTPNVLGMGAFATDAFTSKPSVSSGNYVDKMSDHCAACPYDVDATTGEAEWAAIRERASKLRERAAEGSL
jgi:deoxyribodipyrimidine photolyase-related protein